MRLLVSLVIVIGLIAFLRSIKIKKALIISLVLGYIITVLIITLVTRQVKEETHISLDPLGVYKTIITVISEGYRKAGRNEFWKRVNWYIPVVINIFLNIFLFVPLGYLLPLLSDRLRKASIVIWIGFSFSLIIETIQLVFHLGWFDASDILHNTIGILVGYILYKAFLSSKQNDLTT